MSFCSKNVEQKWAAFEIYELKDKFGYLIKQNSEK